jgi:hypothetical protein
MAQRGRAGARHPLIKLAKRPPFREIREGGRRLQTVSAVRFDDLRAGLRQLTESVVGYTSQLEG